MRFNVERYVVGMGLLCAALMGSWPARAAGDAVLLSDVAVNSATASVGTVQDSNTDLPSASAGVVTSVAEASANATNLSDATGPTFSSLSATLLSDATTSSIQSGAGVYGAGRAEAGRTIDFTLNAASGYLFQTFLTGELGDNVSSLLASVTLLDISGSPVEIWKHSLNSTHPFMEFNEAGTLNAGTYRLLFSAISSSANGPVDGPFPADWLVVTSSTVAGTLSLGAPPVVPLPGAAAAGFLLCGGIAGLRRRHAR